MRSRTPLIADVRCLTLLAAAPCQARVLGNNASGGWVAHRAFAKRR